MLNDDIGESRARQSGHSRTDQTCMAKQNIMFTMIFLQLFDKQEKRPYDYLKRGYEHERS